VLEVSRSDSVVLRYGWRRTNVPPIIIVSVKTARPIGCQLSLRYSGEAIVTVLLVIFGAGMLDGLDDVPRCDGARL